MADGEDIAKLLKDVLIEELKDVRTDVRLIRTAQQEHGTEVAQIKEHVSSIDARCVARGEKCSAEFKKLGSNLETVENTGVHNIINYSKWTMAWKIVQIVVASIVTAATLALSAYGLFKCGMSSARGRDAAAAAAPSIKAPPPVAKVAR